MPRIPREQPVHGRQQQHEQTDAAPDAEPPDQHESEEHAAQQGAAGLHDIEPGNGFHGITPSGFIRLLGAQQLAGEGKGEADHQAGGQGDQEQGQEQLAEGYELGGRNIQQPADRPQPTDLHHQQQRQEQQQATQYR